MTHYSHPQDVLELITGATSKVALVVVTAITGGTLRSKGALMAVSPENAYGYISAGCVDGDIIFQARQALTDGKDRKLIYGEGSPFKDIALPCGGTIHVRIIPEPNQQEISAAAETLGNRQKAILILDDDQFAFSPKLRLRIVGRSAPFSALASVAHQSGIEVIGQSPDQSLNQDSFARFDHLTHPDQIPPTADDPWTAVIFLFHDHDWEPALLEQALQGESFYIGAMGSEQTHAARVETLKAMGASNTDRIRGPIGLIPAMRNANMLAISILAEIVDEARKSGRLS